jgi:hypothetical protein
MADRNVTEEQVGATMEAASGRYAAFKTEIVNGVQRYGYWSKGRLVITEFDGQGDAIVINVMEKSRQAVDAIIKAAGG